MKLPLPDSIVSKMSPKDRPKGWISGEEAQRRFKRGEEKKLQRLVANYFNLRGIYYETDRMDKRTSGKVGRLDFRCCYQSRFVAFECKCEGEEPTKEQEYEMARIWNSGGVAKAVYSLQDVIDFLRTTDEFFNR
jgi:hypothetical protein